jgi:hypothetical protein
MRVIFVVKYTLSYRTKFGSVSAESENPDDLVIGYQTLKGLVPRLGFPEQSRQRAKKESKKRSIRKGPRPINYSKKRTRSSKGLGETASIIRELEGKILPTAFFSRPRTTGETRAKLIEISGQDFTSRKVSQALGILWNKGTLKRSGTRNYFVYSK